MIQILDLSGDGILDLLVSNVSDDHISIFVGTGDGSFVAAATYLSVPTIGLGASGVAVADFNGDGIPDIVVANGKTPSNGQPAAVILPGLGLGGFGPPVPIPGQDGSRVVAGDWNGDGKADLAFTVERSAPNPSRLVILLGNGNMTFGAPTTIPLPDVDFNADFLVAADVNGDGKPDLLVANTGTGNVSVFLNNGAGGFTPQPTVSVGSRPSVIAVGDFNGDGKPDLAVTAQGDFGALNGALAVLLGNGNGTFQAPQPLLSAGAPDSVAVGDWNGDGKLDLAVVVENPQFVWKILVLLGDGQGGFGAPTVVPIPSTLDLVTGIRAVDVDRDGHLDLLVSVNGSQLAVLRGRGNGTFEGPVLFDSGGGQAVAADLNNDGRPDFVLATQVGLVGVLLNASTKPSSNDFNGDGKADILWRHSSGVVYTWLMDGTSVSSAGSPGNVAPDWTIAGMADWNGDGKADILWRHSSGFVYIWLMDGTRVIGSGSPGSVGTGWTIVGVGDFNNDGRADILWRHSSGLVYIWLMDGTSVIGTGSPGSVGTDWTIAGVGDFNADGRAGILWRHISGAVYIWLMDGLSTVGAGSPGSVSTDWSIQGVGDFDADGKADILWRHSSGLVYLWSMNGTTVSSAGSPGTAGPDWTINKTVDLNGDGKADILWRHTSGVVYVWLMNGASIIGTGSPGTVDSGWAIQ